MYIIGVSYMTNFDFLLAYTQFNTFSSAAAAAERVTHIDPAAGVINCRRAMEFCRKVGVGWTSWKR